MRRRHTLFVETRRYRVFSTTCRFTIECNVFVSVAVWNRMWRYDYLVRNIRLISIVDVFNAIREWQCRINWIAFDTHSFSSAIQTRVRNVDSRKDVHCFPASVTPWIVRHAGRAFKRSVFSSWLCNADWRKRYVQFSGWSVSFSVEIVYTNSIMSNLCSWSGCRIAAAISHLRRNCGGGGPREPNSWK